MQTLDQRITADGITARARMRATPPAFEDPADHQRDPGRRWYDVTLTMDGRTMVVPFGMGSAHSERPSAADVLNCLASDASTYDQARGFEDWAADLGFDTDSRKAERIYREVGKQARELRAFLGDKYDAYLYETESL